MGTSDDLDIPLQDQDVRPLRVDIPETVRLHLDSLKKALAREGFGLVSNGDLIGCLILCLNADEKAQIEELFQQIRSYRTTLPRDLMVSDSRGASVLPLERKAGRPSRRGKPSSE